WNGNPVNRSSKNNKSSKPATPMEPQHNHFSIAGPFTANIPQPLLTLRARRVPMRPARYSLTLYRFLSSSQRAIRKEINTKQAGVHARVAQLVNAEESHPCDSNGLRYRNQISTLLL